MVISCAINALSYFFSIWSLVSQIRLPRADDVVLSCTFLQKVDFTHSPAHETHSCSKTWSFSWPQGGLNSTKVAYVSFSMRACMHAFMHACVDACIVYRFCKRTYSCIVRAWSTMHTGVYMHVWQRIQVLQSHSTPPLLRPS